jgi:hypothetical protein
MFLDFYQASKGTYDKDLSRNKMLKDKVAASIILQRFLDIYNKEIDLKEEEEINKISGISEISSGNTGSNSNSHNNKLI